MVKDGVLGVVGDVLRHEALHGGYHGHVVVGVGLGDQGVYLAAHIGPVIFTDTGDASPPLLSLNRLIINELLIYPIKCCPISPV